MTQEEKDLLFKDLCARLLYGVKVYGNFRYGSDEEIIEDARVTTLDLECLDWLMNEIEVKPYLRPMSSMTEEEIIELKRLNEKCDTMPTFEYVPIENYRIYDWLNAHHFDYRGLIEKGLAIKVTEENNPYKN